MSTKYYHAEAKLAAMLKRFAPATKQLALMYRRDQNAAFMVRSTITDREDYDAEYRDQSPYDQCYQIPYTSNMTEAMEIMAAEFMHAALKELPEELDVTDSEGVLIYDVATRMTHHAVQSWHTEVTRTSHTFTPRMEFAS